MASLLGHFLGMSDILGRLLDALFFEFLLKKEESCRDDIISKQKVGFEHADKR